MLMNKQFSKKSALLLAMTIFNSGLAVATETDGEKVKNETKEVVKDAKQKTRKARAKLACKANDKKCHEAKAKAAAENAKDEIKQKAEEAKDKID